MSTLFAQTLDLTSAVDTATNGFRIHYAGADSHVHELYLNASSFVWHDADLTAIAGGPSLALGGSIASALDRVTGQFRVDYAGADSHVHELYLTDSNLAWRDADLTAITGGPSLVRGGSLTSAVDTTTSEFRIDYAGADSHVHELYLNYSNYAWHDADLTVITRAPSLAAGGSIASAVDTTTNEFRIDYTGADSHLHELYLNGWVWKVSDLTVIAGGPSIAAGGLIASAVDATTNEFRIDYAGADSHLHELYLNAWVWKDADLTTITGGPSLAPGGSIASATDITTNEFRIDYTGADSHLHELYLNSWAWKDADLTAITGGLLVAVGGSIASAADTTTNEFRIDYIGVDSHVHELYLNSWAWKDADLTLAGGSSVKTFRTTGGSLLPSLPAKEYIHLNGKIVAIENGAH